MVRINDEQIHQKKNSSPINDIARVAYYQKDFVLQQKYTCMFNQ